MSFRGIINKRIFWIAGLILILTLCMSGIDGKAYAAESTTSKYTGITYSHNSALQGYIVANGVDISNWQEDVDWAKIKADGIDFAIIRAAGRGYTAGTMYDDVRFVKNIQEAKANGIMVGVYFFSQAKTVKEAQNEVNRSIKLIEQAGYDASDLDLPLFMDYEMAGTSKTGRLYGMTKAERTEVAKAWLEYARSKGYTPGIYTDLNFSSTKVNGKTLSGLGSYWAAQYYTLNQFPFDYTWWQYSSAGKVDGVTGGTDMNFWYIDPNCPSSVDADPAPSLRQMSGFAQTEASLDGTAMYSITECGVGFTGSSSFTYGKKSKFEPSVSVTHNGKELALGTDYKVRYVGNTQTGTAYAIVIGQGQYADYKAVPFKIKAAKGDSSLTYSEVTDKKYTGKERKPSVTITDPNGKKLINGTDYVISYENNINVGQASIIINFMGNYKGSYEIPFNIVKATQVVTIADQRTETVLQDGPYALGVTTKFETPITYSSSDTEVAQISPEGVITPIKAGTTTITIKCATNENFKSKRVQFELTVTDPEATEETVPGEVEPGGEVTPGEGTDPSGEVTPGEGTDPSGEVTPGEGTDPSGEVTPGEGTDPSEEVTPGEGTDPSGETTPGEGTDPSGEVTPGEETDPSGEVTPGENEASEPTEDETKISIKGATVASISSKIWTGNKKKPSVVVTLNGVKLVKGTDYKVSFKNNRNVGKATVTITGKGNYTGKKTKTFKIIPIRTSIKKLTSNTKSITVKWKRRTTKMSVSRITGYQIQRATNKSFTKNKKTKKVTGYKKTSCTFTGLKAKRTYYIRIRTYMKVGDKTYYSKWSPAKKIKTKAIKTA